MWSHLPKSRQSKPSSPLGWTWVSKTVHYFHNSAGNGRILVIQHSFWDASFQWICCHAWNHDHGTFRKKICFSTTQLPWTPPSRSATANTQPVDWGLFHWGSPISPYAKHWCIIFITQPKIVGLHPFKIFSVMFQCCEYNAMHKIVIYCLSEK